MFGSGLFEVYFRLRNGKLPIRTYMDAPIVIYTKNYFFNKTRLGRLSARSTEFSHNLG
jgi:hypothetical protein